MEDDIDNDKKGKKPKRRSSRPAPEADVGEAASPAVEPDADADPDLDELLRAGGPDALDGPDEGGFLSASELIDDDQGSPEIRERVGQRLRQLRKRARLTQTELGLRSGGIRAGEISRFENGERLPSVETLAKLARGLELPLRDLAALDDLPDPGTPEVEELASKLQGQQTRTLRLAIAVIEALLKSS
ncbi:helix-turn-helix domain-containing protein [Myxococcota bacterium]|nr:helix-turn-helix domain-containing protein [Myxococcota bacterium]